MLLIDTNIWLEHLLTQDRAEEVADFLNRTPAARMCLSDFSYHSIGVIALRLKKPEVLELFTQDVLLDAGVSLARLSPREMLGIPQLCKQHRFDFDDAYQYLTAKTFGMELVSFDRDFDNKGIERLEPKDIR